MIYLGVNKLRDGIGWILFTYPDSTKRIVRTTLNEEILGSVLKDKKDYDLFDLDKMRWIRLPSNPEVVVTIHDEIPELGEVDKFVNRFI